MWYLKKRKLKKQLEELSNEELVTTFRVFIILSYLQVSKDLFETLQMLLEEIHIRDDCSILLLKELELLCVNGIVTPYFVLEEVVCRELLESDAIDLLSRQIATDNLKNWIRFVYTKGLDVETSKMISEADVDRMYQELCSAHTELGSL